ncbi:MAG TPA: Asp-tRNA(Asn)/Glu-tRNA(Gln) amidotransferase subunit GatC [Chitinophagaceae bacterium]|nr:Asp-tRNA(Asn)/Glu-tRNA(Gln) amidotransferase subunit GatC [Chitinophagaceae bacterium]
MEVTEALVQKLAHLARLEISPAELPEVQEDLHRMIAFVEKLNGLDTTGVPPLLHMSEEINVLREDQVQGSVSREEALRNAPLQDGRFFLVPRVIQAPEDTSPET